MFWRLRKKLRKGFGRHRYSMVPPPPLIVKKVASYEDFEKYAVLMQEEYIKRRAQEKIFISSNSSFHLPGYCFVCKAYIEFQVDFSYSCKVDGILTPNWRETLICPYCQLNNRMRASIHIFEQECKPTQNAKIYATEQITPLFKLLRAKYIFAIGSEYRENLLPPGKSNTDNIRNEDLTKLTFNYDEFDFILSFDVFEHISDYKKALSECLRCLRPGGRLFFSIPLQRDRRETLVLTRLNSDGTIVHIFPPDYHGNPLTKEGSLCFQYFGWDLLDQLREMGWENVVALFYWSREWGYLGWGDQMIFMASKSHLKSQQQSTI